jgi:hypothetical protein
VPSTRSPRRSARPLCREYSSILWTSVQRSVIALPVLRLRPEQSMTVPRTQPRVLLASYGNTGIEINGGPSSASRSSGAPNLG